jgi:hypothetical protein
LLDFNFNTTNTFILELNMVLGFYAEILDLDACLGKTKTLA